MPWTGTCATFRSPAATGQARSSLAEILAARKRKSGRRFIETPKGWVDCEAEALDGLALLSGPAGETDEERCQGPERGEAGTGQGGVRLSRLELLRLRALDPTPWEVAGGDREKRAWVAAAAYHGAERDLAVLVEGTHPVVVTT